MKSKKPPTETITKTRLAPATPFARRLRALREARGFAVNELATLADLDNEVVRRIEIKADPRWSTVCKLARALGVGVEEFQEK